MGSKLRICITFVIMLGSVSIQAQSNYIVLNSGDTLWGKIKKPSATYLLHHGVGYVAENEKRSYKFDPYELKSFSLNGQEYVSHYIWVGSNLMKKFLKPIITGYCTLYEYKQTTQNVKGRVMEPITRFFVMRPNERLHELKFFELKAGEDLYFFDHKEIQIDLQLGKYSKKNVSDLIKRYNEAKSIQ